MKFLLTALLISSIGLTALCFAGPEQHITLPTAEHIYQACQSLRLETFAKRTNIHDKLGSKTIAPRLLSSELDQVLSGYTSTMGLNPDEPFAKMTIIGRKHEILTAILTAEDFNLMCSEGFTEHRLD